MAAKTLRILCFGDSLTDGYTSGGVIRWPYADKLEEMIKGAFPEMTVETEIDGVPGDRVTKPGTFIYRMEQQFSDPDDKPYDWTIVLGGTNDIAYSNTADNIFTTLKEIWGIALSRGSKVLALTVPEAGARVERVDKLRNELNAMIKSHKEENLYVFDLHAAVPYWALSEADRKRYWDDNIHFTTDGYDLIGHKIGLHLVSMLVKEKAKTNPQRPRKIFKDDYQVFDEERGSPNEIHQGYVVVRKKDLA